MKKKLLVTVLVLVLMMVLALPMFAATSHASINSRTGTYANGNAITAYRAGIRDQ